MRKYYFEKKFRKKLLIFFKKDQRRYKIIMKKIEEITDTNKIHHYKNLRKPLQDYKRIKINSHFVILFKYDKSKDSIYFFDLDHHDKIYRN
jgi:mRNA-degrading endonuclease RelE of RelBE toxin-antitoxin system